MPTATALKTGKRSLTGAQKCAVLCMIVGLDEAEETRANRTFQLIRSSENPGRFRSALTPAEAGRTFASAMGTSDMGTSDQFQAVRAGKRWWWWCFVPTEVGWRRA